MATDDTPYDIIIVGAGPAGLSAGYEIKRAAEEAGKPLKLLIVTEKISWPTKAGTNIVFGVDGFEEGELPPNAAAVNNLVRGGLARIQQIAREEKIDCRLDMNYQMVAPTKAENTEVADFLIDRFAYKPEEFREVKNPADHLQFAGLGEAIETKAIGQLNAPEYLQGLAAAIRRMGGEIIENTSYTGHQKTGAITEVHTSTGTYKTSAPLLLAGGAHLMKKIDDLPIPVTPVYTMAMHVQLTPEDAKKVCAHPVAFFNPTHDFLWGSLDSNNVLTMGQGDLNSIVERPRIEKMLRETFHTILPQLKGKYDDQLNDEANFSLNAMASTKNKMPIVGRLADCDVITGNCGRGFAQGAAQAQAYADYFVKGDDSKLQLFESLNPAVTPVHPGARARQQSAATLQAEKLANG